jgi:hypothetical protein
MRSFAGVGIILLAAIYLSSSAVATEFVDLNVSNIELGEALWVKGECKGPIAPVTLSIKKLGGITPLSTHSSLFCTGQTTINFSDLNISEPGMYVAEAHITGTSCARCYAVRTFTVKKKAVLTASEFSPFSVVLLVALVLFVLHTKRTRIT